MTNPSAAEPDAVMARIGEGVELGQRGERAAARDLFAGLWDEIDDPLHRCALARHHLDLGRAAVGTLGDDGYGRMISGGLDRLAARLP